MPMVHHDARDYKVAVSEAAAHFQQKIEQMIHMSVPRVKNVIEQVHNDRPEDAIVLAKAIEFTEAGNGVQAIIPHPQGKKVLDIHDHAFYQIAERTGIRNLSTVLRELRARGQWGAASASNLLNEIFQHFNGDRFLVRSVRDRMLGFLSDKYRRLDSQPILDAFIDAVTKFGAQPLDGFALQTKMNMRAILPFIFEPFPGEVMVFGVQLSTSDFGDGKLSVSGIVERMLCTNLATTEDVLQQIHLGRKISDDLIFSQETMKLDTQTMASAVDDVVGYVLKPEAIERYCNRVRAANGQKIEPEQIDKFAKANLTKAETEQVKDKFASADVELLPPGQTTWRWSNALSWLANATDDEHRKLELQEFAGSILKPKPQQS